LVKIFLRGADSRSRAAGIVSSPRPYAGPACALILGNSGAYRVGAVTTDESPVLIADHRPELDTR